MALPDEWTSGDWRPVLAVALTVTRNHCFWMALFGQMIVIQSEPFLPSPRRTEICAAAVTSAQSSRCIVVANSEFEIGCRELVGLPSPAINHDAINARGVAGVVLERCFWPGRSAILPRFGSTPRRQFVRTGSDGVVIRPGCATIATIESRIVVEDAAVQDHSRLGFPDRNQLLHRERLLVRRIAGRDLMRDVGLVVALCASRRRWL